MSVPARIVDTVELAAPRSGTLDVAQGPFRDNLVFSAELAHIVATTSFVPQTMRGNEAEIVGALMHGFELGLTPMQSLRSIAPIDGKPAISAEAIRALVISRGHELWLEESTATRCIACGRRRGQEHTARVTWTLDDANRAGIGGKPNWRRYPAEMLRARATAALCRLHFPDVTLGLLTIEELEDEGAPSLVPGEAPLGAPAAPSTPPRRRRRTTTTQSAPLASVPAAAPLVVPAGPPLPGEEPAPAQPDAVTAPQQRKLHALLREHDLGIRDKGLAFCSSIVGHELASSKDLTSEQASRIIDVLTNMPKKAAQAAEFERDVIQPAAQAAEQQSELVAIGVEARLEAFRMALQALSRADRNDLEGLIVDTGHAPSVVVVSAELIESEFPDLEPNPKALLRLRDELAKEQP